MSYSSSAATLFRHIQAAADTNSVPRYEKDEAVISILQHLHMSDLIDHDDDAIDSDGPNNIDVSRMVPNGTANNDYTTGGRPGFQQQIRKLLHEYDDILSYNVKGKAMSVPGDRQWPNHYTTWSPTTKQKTKSRAWTPDSHIAFEKLKALVK